MAHHIKLTAIAKQEAATAHNDRKRGAFEARAAGGGGGGRRGFENGREGGRDFYIVHFGFVWLLVGKKFKKQKSSKNNKLRPNAAKF